MTVHDTIVFKPSCSDRWRLSSTKWLPCSVSPSLTQTCSATRWTRCSRWSGKWTRSSRTPTRPRLCVSASRSSSRSMRRSGWCRNWRGVASIHTTSLSTRLVSSSSFSLFIRFTYLGTHVDEDFTAESGREKSIETALVILRKKH